MFNSVLNESTKPTVRSGDKYSPAVNVKESDQSFELELWVPGYKKEQLVMRNADGILLIKATLEEKDEEENYNRKEFGLNSFERSFKLPDNVKVNAITAKYINGILLVNLPKQELVNETKEVVIDIE
jgi:HSP20 family protein